MPFTDGPECLLLLFGFPPFIASNKGGLAYYYEAAFAY
jgi:hypothetical protein